MAEEIIDTPVTHEKHIVEEGATDDVNHHKSSIVSLPNGGSSRRNSTSKSDSPQNIVPNYLRVSTGSCHDLCKYGKKHAVEEKPWKKKPVRKGKATTSPSNSLDFIQIKVAGEAKKENVARMSLEAKACSHKENAVSSEKSRSLRKSSPVKKTPSSEPPEVIKRLIASPSQEMEVLEKSSSSTGGKGSKTEVKTDDSSEKRTPANSKLIKVKPLSSSVGSDNKNGKGEIKGNKGSKSEEKTNHSSENRASAKSKLIKVKPSSSSVDSDGKDGKRETDGGKGLKTEEKTDHSSEKRASAKSKLTKVRPLFSSVDSDANSGKGEIDSGKGSKTDEKMDHNVEKRAPIKSKLTKVKPLSSVDSDGKNGKGEINSRVKTEKKILVPKASAKKALSPTASTSSPKSRHTRTLSFDGKKAGSLKLASLMKDRSKTRMAGAKMSKNEKVAEKTLHVVKVETGSSTKSFPRIKDVEAKENSKKTPRSRVVPSEDKYRSSLKLQFRSGKVVELRSDNNTPRRLKFRKTRAPGGEDVKSEVTKKSLSKTGVNADVAGADIVPRKVVLKRQVVQGKKVARVLLNNVIEETASKLVESRKSKVKALVGAFETVISLHEVKSSRTVKLGGE